MSATGQKLRKKLRETSIFTTIGAGDALMAKIADQTEHIDGILTSGFAISAHQLGLPDAELYTRSDNIYVVHNACAVVNKPVIADIDTGYGNAVSVIRSVQEFERAGAAGVIIEDQVSPKRCPICVDELNNILPIEEAVGKIRAAAEGRLKKDTVIIARTDATNPEEAIKRAKLYRDAGADLVQPISKAFKTKEQLREFVKSVESPVSLVIVGWLEQLTFEEIEYIGPKIAHFALATVNAAHAAATSAVKHIAANKTMRNMPVEQTNHIQMVQFLGMPLISEQEQKYLPDEKKVFGR
ncbi:oxaloacetate decarboxylase [Neobacillus niacini]|uniref:isocitrate lyase/PEP mutase family protein n=1 Tax=Neobacillus niacini TaxID=86668 RepID=UPI0021CAE391|nr:isocitrate lyase/PEP mutase family protein [Neobacillus niacini]MCM3767771.1 isocitrate lyase/PEP mutase family protein [Neobacillus niacini]